MDDGGELIGLIDAFGDAGTGAAGEKRGGKAEDVAEGGDDEIGLHCACDTCAEVVGAEGKKVAGGADEEEEGDGLDEGFEGLVGGTGGDELLGGGRFDEEAGDLVDSAAVDERLKEIGGSREEGEEGDDGELAAMIFGEAEKGMDNAAIWLGSGHTSVCPGAGVRGGRYCRGALGPWRRGWT